MKDIVIKENGLVLQFCAGNGFGLKAFSSELIEKEIPEHEAAFYAPEQVHISGGNRNGHLGLKHLRASESETARFVEMNKLERADFTDYVFVLLSENVRVNSVYRFYNGVKAVAVTNTVTNISLNPVTIEEVNSICLFGLKLTSDNAAEKLKLYIPHNSWYVEAQWKAAFLGELGLKNGNDKMSMKRISVDNTGSWSTKEYLPMGILEDTEDGSFLLWQIESSSSWHYEIGDYDNRIYLNAGGPDFDNNQWCKTLQPGESFTGVTASLTHGGSLNEVMDSVTCYRRAIRRKNKDNIELPFIYNAYMHSFWDYPTEKGLIPVIDAAAKLGIDYFCIDAGWHDEENWTNKMGGWEESKTRFPSGLQKTIDYIKKSGMKAGLWVEIENIGTECPSLDRFSSDCFLQHNGKPVRKHNRQMFDFSNPKVIKYADSVIDKMMAYGIEYIKMDYNLDTGPGTDYNSDSFGDGLLKSNRGFIKWLSSLYERYPDVIIENCASGGCRMDYAMLAINSIQSTSDQTNYKKYAHLSSNIFSAVTPEQAAVWNYPVTDAQVQPDDEAIIMNSVNSILGRVHFASFINVLSEEKLELMREGIIVAERMKKDKVVSKPYFPLGFSDFTDKNLASGIINGNKLYLAVWNLEGASDFYVPLDKKVLSVKTAYPKARPLAVRKTAGGINITFTEKVQARLLEIELGE